MKTIVSNYAPGIIIALTISLAAMFLGEHYEAPTMLFAVLLGMSFSFLRTDEKCAAGLEFAAKTLLKVGVALLGVRLTLGDFVALGPMTLGWIALAIITTIILGYILSARSSCGGWFGVLTGGAVGICGASAALAISTVIPKSEKNDQFVTLTVLGVTTMSTLAMIIYPVLSEYLGWNDTQAGIFFGATIHDVAQVAGAGFSVSDEAGNAAVMVKLIRVAMLFPVVVVLGIIASRIAATNGGVKEKVAVVPAFLVVFAVLVGINSVGAIPTSATPVIVSISKLFLTAGVAALGVRSELSKTLQLGLFPIFVLVAETVWIAVFIAAIMYFGGMTA
ncbi:UPF0324 membrane protein RB0971 [Kordiimonas sediminis]|uniref:UPF0324 membrane protein RB0971 n=1 Tax=Kordiimonas sediminis TaxID=1735581 RepID=A0A919AU04_9PROT|nr:putative sulfate exporter family transporter [Kordiimonas sediminis]GHF25345.1 UPF0324 membrane protein RB0971 [Kordiimonas sediminis]